MATLIQRGASVHGSRLKLAAGRSVTVRRGTKSVTVTAAVTLLQYEVLDENGLTQVVESWDWTFTAADLLIDGETVKPIRGWEIREGDTRYEVMPIGREPENRYLDSFETLLLVHSKRVSP